MARKLRRTRGSRATRHVSLSIVALMMLGLAACGDDDSKDAAPSGSSDGACTADRVDADSVLTVDSYVPTTSLDPVTAPGALRDDEVNAALYDTLTRYDAKTGLYVPFLAEEVTPNDDFTEWTVKLRSGIKFGNGDPLTAADVAFSLNRWKTDVATSGAKAFTGPILSTEAVDELTAVITLDRPYAGFAWILSDMPGMIVNQKVVEAQGDAFPTSPGGAGVGPFEFVKFTAGEEVVLKGKTDYWGGPVCIGTLRYESVPGAQTKLDALENGEIDVATIQGNPAVSKALDETDGISGVHYLRAGNGLTMNQKPGRVLADVRLRQAIAKALDPDLINQRAFEGAAIMANTLTVPEQKIWGGVEGVDYDLEGAKELVAEAVSDGVDPSINFVTPDTTNPELVLVVEALLKNAGFNVDVETLSYDGFLPRWNASDFDVIVNVIGTGEDSPFGAMTLYASDNTRNLWGVNDPDIDAAIDKLYLAESPEETAAVFGELQELWNETSPTAVAWVEDVSKGISDRVHGIEEGPRGRLSYATAYVSD